MDPHLVVLSRNRERRLPFQVEVLLAADPDFGLRAGARAAAIA